MTLSNPKHFPNSPPPNTITLGLGRQHISLGEGKHKYSVHTSVIEAELAKHLSLFSGGFTGLENTYPFI